MKNIKKLFKKISGIALCLILVLYNIPVAFAAGSVALSITGPGTASVGDKITLTFRTSSVSSDDGKIYSLGGTLNFDDTILKVNSCASKAAGLNGGSVNGKIIGLYDASYATGVGNNADLMSCEFEALATGSTTVTISSLEINDINTDVLSSSITGKLVTVGGAAPTSSSTSKPTSSSTSSTSTSTSSSSAPAPSTNAKPTSISVSGYTMSPTFNADTKDYTVTVPATASYVTINVTKGDSKQTVTGDGNFTLTGDTSTAKVVITAEDGVTKKEYNITVKKQAVTPTLDGDNSLSDLTKIKLVTQWKLEQT